MKNRQSQLESLNGHKTQMETRENGLQSQLSMHEEKIKSLLKANENSPILTKSVSSHHR